jgi:hypothetical protein
MGNNSSNLSPNVVELISTYLVYSDNSESVNIDLVQLQSRFSQISHIVGNLVDTLNLTVRFFLDSNKYKHARLSRQLLQKCIVQSRELQKLKAMEITVSRNNINESIVSLIQYIDTLKLNYIKRRSLLDLIEFGNLKKLKKLELYRCDIHYSSNINNEFEFSNNNIFRSVINKLNPNVIKTLEIDTGHHSAIRELYRIPSILPQLQSLSIANSSKVGINDYFLSHVSKCKNLKVLKLNFKYSNLTAAAGRSLSKLTKLTKLVLVTCGYRFRHKFLTAKGMLPILSMLNGLLCELQLGPMESKFIRPHMLPNLNSGQCIRFPYKQKTNVLFAKHLGKKIVSITPFITPKWRRPERSTVLTF